MKKSRLFLILSGLLCLTWLIAVFYFEKWNASWGWVNVGAVAFASAFAIALVFRFGLRWFYQPVQPTPMYMFVLAIVMFVGSLLAGLFCQELPARQYAQWQQEEQQRQRSGSSYVYVAPSSPSTSSSSGPSSFDGLGDSMDDMGEGAIVIVIIILIVALVVMSAFITHFWVVGTFIALALLALFSIREYELEKEVAV